MIMSLLSGNQDDRCNQKEELFRRSQALGTPLCCHPHQKKARAFAQRKAWVVKQAVALLDHLQR